MSHEQFIRAPQSESCRRIDFEKAEVRPGFVNDTYILIVSGTAPCLNMEVHLFPLIYIDCPEYWGIEVVGCLPGGVCLDAIKPYTVTLPLSHVTGSRGIEVIGATKTERFEVPGGCK